MTDVATVHRALSDVVKSIVRDLNVSPWPFSGMPTPRIEVWPGDDYLDYYGESDSDDGPMRVRWRLRIDLSTADPETAFLTMTDLLAWDGLSSIRAALMGERSLSGRVDDTVVLSAQWETDEANEAQTAWVVGECVVSKG